MNVAPDPQEPDGVYFANFNQDNSCLSVGTKKGFRIYNCEPFGKCYENHEGGSGICEMMFSSSLVAVAGIGEPSTFSPRKLRILNTKRQTVVCELNFPTKILAVKMNRKRLVVVLEDKISIYDLATMAIVHTIETLPNSNAVCALATDPERSYLAYPTNQETGELSVFDAISLQTVCAIQAHKSAISQVAFNADGTLLATASDKGTIIRVFSIPDASNVHQFRRGTYPATIFGMSFNTQSDLLAVSSDSDTIHIFKLKPRKRSKILGQVFGEELSMAIESARHFAYINLPSSRIPNICAITANSTSVSVITGDGYFSIYSLDLAQGGECKLQRRYRPGRGSEGGNSSPGPGPFKMLAGPPHSPERSAPAPVNMKSIEIDSFREQCEDEAVFRKVSQALWSGRRIIVVTGAGISVSSGIPDFRSAGGLYERLGLKFGTSGSGSADNKSVALKGKDFFDASFFHAEKTRPLFFKFIAELKEMCDDAQPTPTHHFLRELILEKRVLRWYTQNIDGLEERVGLETTVTIQSTASLTPNKTGAPSVPVIGLHGTLARLSCTVCRTSVAYEQHEKLKSGSTPECGTCQERIKDREARGQRKIRGGVLRPDIVLYNEPHPQGDLIAEALSADLGKRPTMLLVIGTSLKVVGLKRMIKDIAKAVHGNSPDGLVVYMNKTGVQARSEWRGVFDYELVGECDRWVDLFRQQKEKPADKAVSNKSPAPPTEISTTPIRPAAKTKKIDTFFKHIKSAVSVSKDKENKVPPAIPPASSRTKQAVASALMDPKAKDAVAVSKATAAAAVPRSRRARGASTAAH